MILIGADFVPTKENEVYFVKGETEFFLGAKLRERLETANYRIFNLETPLTDTPKPIAKCGANLIAPTAAVNGYEAAGVDLLTLANNHIMDQGVAGLYSTIQALREAGIPFLGVGDTPAEAAAPYFFQCFGKTVGVYACAEHEFSIVTEEKPGANPFEPLDSPDHIANLKKNCDYVIVLYHGGKEYYPYPSPMLQKTCRKMIEKGADLVLCQHTHCIGCEEHFQGGVIVYGQGNFLFGKRPQEESWQTGMLVCLDEKFSVYYLPLTVSEDGAMVELAEPEKEEQLRKEFQERSEQIQNGTFISDNYSLFAERSAMKYAKAFAGKESILFKVLNRMTGGWLRSRWLKRRYPLENKLAIDNFVSCEAHRELLLVGLYQGEKSEKSI